MTEYVNIFNRILPPILYIPGLGRSPGVGNDNLLQYSCLENPMDRRAWSANIPGVAKSWTRLGKWTHTHTHTHTRRRTHTQVDCSYIVFFLISIPSLFTVVWATCWLIKWTDVSHHVSHHNVSLWINIRPWVEIKSFVSWPSVMYLAKHKSEVLWTLVQEREPLYGVM